MITVASVPLDDPRATALWDRQQAELHLRYGEPDIHPNIDADGFIVSLLGVTAQGEAVGTVMLRWSQYHPSRPGYAEIKRLYVSPEHRGHGHARVLMGALERAAWRVGATHLVLETGTKQPEAIAVYRGIGYVDIPSFGPYEGEPDSVCMGRSLPTRLLVINGSMGAGKTEIMGAAFSLLEEAGAHAAQIDADYLCEATPRPAGDRFNEALLFANLKAIAPHYHDHGAGLILVARVIETADDRARYPDVFAASADGALPAAGPADVTVVRLEASDQTRQARLRSREPVAYYESFARHRTTELAEAIRDADVDDAVVDNDAAVDDAGRDRYDVAREVLQAADWWAPGAESLA